ncbi:hypothetical protein [Escherichia coli]|nr:hypothetical protein [Escherichia coli]
MSIIILVTISTTQENK